ncbi:golgin candidate [Thalictrum thalictroides]|uniref:Golgin candidate n=1 Tax=Thalictrum thalictroides TaxID=46969 RepID=A0A7J6VQP2_THATH|nr:golgin candidate [Thalictrum thalictroides]
MDFKLGRINLNAVAQGVGGLVFGNENSSCNEDSYVERLLDRISNGVLAEDRRAAITQLQAIVAESRSAQLAFGAMGFPVLMGVLKEERDDVEMVRGALETLVSALTPTDVARGPKNEVQPTLMNSDLLSREAESIPLLLSLLEEDDFYVRYYTLQLLTALLTHSPNRLQEAILTTPRGITRLMDMLMDREVIRNEALLLLTYLTREAVGAFEKIFSIIKEEGGSEGGVVVQDCLDLLNNLLRRSASNQILLRETIGFEHLLSILKLRGSAYNFTQQKKNALDHLLMLGVESPWAAVSVRCAALRCVGALVANHPQNLDALASKVLGEEPHFELALNSILRIILRTSSLQEFSAADFIFKCFCEVGLSLLDRA